jgi:hypothetical protein
MAAAKRLWTFGSEQRHQRLVSRLVWPLSREPRKRPDDERHLPDVLAAVSAHQQVNPHLQACLPRDVGVDVLAGSFGNLSAIEHLHEHARLRRFQLRFKWPSSTARTFVRARWSKTR